MVKRIRLVKWAFRFIPAGVRMRMVKWVFRFRPVRSMIVIMILMFGLLVVRFRGWHVFEVKASLDRLPTVVGPTAPAK